MDSGAALALATSPQTSAILTRKPDSKLSPLITFSMIKMIIAESIYQISISFLILYNNEIWNWVGLENEAQIRTFVFNTFVFMQLMNEFK